MNAENNKEKEEKTKSESVQKLKFNLLLLPILAIQNCLRFLELLEFIDFSLFSKRTKFLTSTIHREKIEIDLLFGPYTLINLTLPRYPDKEWMIDYVSDLDEFSNKVLRTVNGKPVRSVIHEYARESKHFYGILFPEENVIETNKWFAEHLKLVLRSPIKSVSVNDYVESHIEILKWLHTLQPNIDFIHIDGKLISSESLSFILQKLQETKKLALYLKPSDDGFQYNQPINVHTFLVSPSWWITMDLLLSSENSMICVYKSSITPSDLNRFIKTWIGGWNKKLKMLEVIRAVERYSVEKNAGVFETITDGIEYKPTTEDSGRPKFVTLPRGLKMDLSQGKFFDIKRDDGKRAAFLHCYFQQPDNVAHRFLFITW